MSIFGFNISVNVLPSFKEQINVVIVRQDMMIQNLQKSNTQKLMIMAGLESIVVFKCISGFMPDIYRNVIPEHRC